VLATEAQADVIAEQWFLRHGGTHEAYLVMKTKTVKAEVKHAEEFTEERVKLSKRFGVAPSDNDVRWSLLNRELLEHSAKLNFGFFRNTKLAMAEILRKEARLREALEVYLEISYLDLNGPNNLGGLIRNARADSKLLREFPPWNPDKSIASLAPGILSRTEQIIAKTKLTPAMVEDVFSKRASVLYGSLHLPLSPSDAWPRIAQALFDEGN